MSDATFNQLPLAPLGAGDLIDRAVRLYRRHLFVLIQTASPPVIVVAAGWIGLTISGRQLFQSSETSDVLLYLPLGLISLLVFIAGYLFTLVVMGGATRTLVAHLLRNDPVSLRATYRAVRDRFWGLLAASVIVLLWIWLASMGSATALYFVFIILGLLIMLTAMVTFPWLSAIIGVVGVIIALVLGFWVFFFIVGRVAYVPQIMLVEGRGVFESFGRSFTLARGNVRRLMAMTLFTTFAAYAALMVLVIPLGWIGYLTGVEVWNSTQWPAWYSISYSVLVPVSWILLTPVWILGLSLLYVDERVRHEGYDIELMAARQLGELPDVDVTSPFGTALSASVTPPPPPAGPRPSSNILNLS